MILVTGATGDLGSRVVRALRRSGADLRCLVRTGSAYFWLNDTGVSYRFGDLRDPDSLRRACRGAGCLLACSGLRTEGRHSRHDNVTRDGHRALWAAAQQAGIRRAVFVSCLGVERGAERSPANQARLDAEDSLQRSDLDAVILRPSLFATTLAAAARFGAEHGWVPMLGSGDNPVSPISLDDLALAVMASVDHAGVIGAPIELGGPDTMSYRQAVHQAIDATGDRARPLAPASSLRRFGLGALSRLQPRWANRLAELQHHASADLSVAGDPLQAVFGLQPTPYAQALRAALERQARPRDIEALYPLVTHRAPRATVYSAGSVPVAELPEGPPRGE